MKRNVTKIISSMLLAGCIGLMLTGCQNKSGGTQEKESGEQKVESRESAQTAGNDQEQKPIRIYAKGEKAVSTAATEEGMYRIGTVKLNDGTEAKCIYYVDYASKKEIPLCSDPGCQHDTTDCKGIFTYKELNDCVDPTIFTVEDKLYVFCQYDESGTTVINYDLGVKDGRQPACLIQMNQDGTDRKKVYTFDEETILESMVFQYGNYLCFAGKTLKEKKQEAGAVYYAGTDRKILGLSIGDWKLKEFCDFPQEMSVAGAYGDRLVCSKTIYPQGYSEESTADMEFGRWREMFDKTKQEILLWQPEKGTTKTLMKQNNAVENSFLVYGDKIYLTVKGKKAVILDLKTGKKDTLSSAALKKYQVIDTCGERLVCWPWNESTGYLWNPENNTVRRCDLREKTTNLAVEILAENKDSFCVAYDSEAEKNEDGSYNIKKRRFGLIAKEDYYRGKAAFTPISMVSNGLSELPEE